MLSGLEGLLAGRSAAHVRWGLERIEEILDGLGRPERRFRALHLAGTNGKGSAAACAHAVLEAAGHRSGLYTSPHLLDARERIRATGGVPPDLLDRCADVVRPLADRCGATYFEAITATAFLAFAELELEWAVLETGLGGRLDATNVASPVASAIVTVALDHAAVLGSSLEEIAAEKAGILKRGVPVALGRLPPEARGAILSRAEELGCPVRELGRDASVSAVEASLTGTRFTYRSPATPGPLALRTPLAGAHQADNAAVALMTVEATGALEPSGDVLARGVASTRLPGRFHVIETARGTWVLDLAHNPAAAEALRATLRATGPPAPVVFLVGILKDKPWREILAVLLDHDDRVVLTVPPSAPSERRWSPAGAVGARAGSREVALDFDRALARARELAGGGTVVVTGSAHTVGGALARLTGTDGSRGPTDRGRHSPGEGA